MKRMLALILSVCLLMAAVLLVGCKKEEAPVMEEDVPVPENACVISIAGNATTGYGWVAREFDADKLNIVEMPYVPDDTEGQQAGAGGTYRFFIQPKDGVTDVEFDVVFRYEQPWDGGDKDGGTATVHITVDGAGVATSTAPELAEP